MISIDSSSSSSSLPQELMIEILLCLPIKTLLRFKSVSKSWSALIDSSEFINRHMLLPPITTTTDNNNNSSSSSSSNIDPFIFLSNNLHTKNFEISWNFFSISGSHEFQVIEDLGIPPCYSKTISREPGMNLDMVGSCNGVICLYDDLLKDVSLWNPAIHQFRHLPKSSIDEFHGDRNRNFIGFGFDLETKDYKVVQILYNKIIYKRGRLNIDIHGVQVYSLNSDSWRTLEDVVVPSLPWSWESDNGGYLNCSYYCLGKKYVLRSIITDIVARPYVHVREESEDGVWESSTEDALEEEVWELFSFDFTKEIFKFWQLPDGMHDNTSTDFHDLGLILFGGKITIIHHHKQSQSYEFFVLNEASGAAKEEGSWTRLYKIGLDEENFDRYMRILGISNDGEYIFVVTSYSEKLSASDPDKLSSINSSTQVIKDLRWDRDHGNNKFMRQIWRAFVYRRSLVPVSSSRK